MGSPHASGSTLNLQQQLEHANQKSGFAEDKFKLQQVGCAPLAIIRLCMCLRDMAQGTGSFKDEN